MHFTKYICRKFELNDLMSSDGNGVGEVRLLPKHLLMSKLEEYNNLVNAMSALFFVSRGM